MKDNKTTPPKILTTSYKHYQLHLQMYRICGIDTQARRIRGLGVKKHDTGFVAVQVLREAYAKNNLVF